METKFIVKYRPTEVYFLAHGEGYTTKRSKAYHYTRGEVVQNHHFNKKRHVLVPVTK